MNENIGTPHISNSVKTEKTQVTEITTGELDKNAGMEEYLIDRDQSMILAHTIFWCILTIILCLIAF
jgi:hypothetical protein